MAFHTYPLLTNVKHLHLTVYAKDDGLYASRRGNLRLMMDAFPILEKLVLLVVFLVNNSKILFGLYNYKNVNQNIRVLSHMLAYDGSYGIGSLFLLLMMMLHPYLQNL